MRRSSAYSILAESLKSSQQARFKRRTFQEIQRHREKCANPPQLTYQTEKWQHQTWFPTCQMEESQSRRGRRSDHAQANVELSLSDIAFAFLIDSHTVVLEPLNDLVITAIKDKHCDAWKDVLKSCFGHGMKQHIEKSLRNSCSLNDIFVVSKIIRCRLNDIAEYLGGQLVDTRNRERLSLYVQGVEEARHMAFHGGFVTLSEVYLNIRYLMSILTYLNCGKARLSALQEIASRIVEKFHSESKSYYMLSTTSVLKAMLYRCLGEFGKRIYRIF